MRRRCGGAVFRVPSGEIVLQKREDRPDINSPGLLHVFGGVAEPGEDGRTAMIREMVEETGIAAEQLEEAEFIGRFEENPSTDGVPNLVDVFVVPIRNRSELKLLEGEAHELIRPDADLSQLPLSDLGRQTLKALGFSVEGV